MEVFIIVVILLGHHSLQAQAMGDMHYYIVADTCESTECHHQMNMEICEKIQSDEIRVPTDFFSLDETSKSNFISITEKVITPDEVLERYRERIPISQKQLARSHL